MVKCKVCGSQTKQIRHPRLGNIYHVCNNCEFISKDEIGFITPEAELRIYNNHNNSVDDPRYVAYFYKFLNEAVFEYVSDGKKALILEVAHLLYWQNC